jgi:Polyketide cyclase / dehydrase and lipid transport
MVQVAGEVVIEAPLADVFDFVADERNVYDPRIRRAEKVSEGPIGVGTRFRTESTSAGRSVGMIVEITTYERPRQLASTTRLSSMDIHSSLVFEPVGEATRMRWSSELAPRGAFKLMTPILAAVGRRQAETIWRNLKRVLEERHVPPAKT